MLSVSATQLDAWLAALMFPLARLLGLFAAAPIFSNRGVSVRVRLAIGMGVALALLPVMPAMPAVPPAAGIGLMIFVQQIFIGVAIGFMMRIVFATVDLAGALIGMQMGLSFAIFFDPDAGGQTAVLSDFLSLIATLLFLAVNGHLLLIEVLVRSFEWLPIGTDIVRAQGWALGNLDTTVVAQAPRLAAHIPAMRARIAQVLDLAPEQVNIKAKTAERLGPVGQCLAIEARAVALLLKA